jgi:hypothetical protein
MLPPQEGTLYEVTLAFLSLKVARSRSSEAKISIQHLNPMYALHHHLPCFCPVKSVGFLVNALLNHGADDRVLSTQ